MIKADIEIVYKNPWFQVLKEGHMHWVDGHSPIYGLSGAVVVPILNGDHIVCVRQFRRSVERTTLELPRGGTEPCDKNGRDIAARELLEETGYQVSNAQDFIELGNILPDTGVLAITVPAYIARFTDADKVSGFDDEIESIELIPFDRISSYILSGEIECGISQAALLRALLYLNKVKPIDPI